MQTFLPYSSFRRSAAVLDWRRLGKQRVEVLQLLNALGPEGRGWKNHPAARMWVGYRPALCAYGLVVCQEWVKLGYRDTCFAKIKEHLLALGSSETSARPPWLGDEQFHRAHRSNLLRKDRDHYSRYWTDVPDDLPYQWPVLQEGGGYVLKAGT